MLAAVGCRGRGSAERALGCTVALIALLAITGCDLVAALGGGAGLRCDSDRACAPGQSCIDQVCQWTDSGISNDAGRDDSGRPVDSGRDVVPTDSPVIDTSAVDQTADRDGGAHDRELSDLVRVDAIAAPDAPVLADAAPVDDGTRQDGGCSTTSVAQLGSVDLACGDRNHFSNIWDLTAGDVELTFDYDATGVIDRPTGARTWGALGVRQVGAGDFLPDTGSGVWLATFVEAAANTLDPDPVDAPVWDIDDKLFLQKTSGAAESAYDLPSAPPASGNNHRFWFDRDGVDPFQAQAPLFVDGGTYNTGGIYRVVIALHATDATHGTAYMTINGLAQGFETDGDWNTMELTPAGMTWGGDMTRIQVFYSLACQNVASTTSFDHISVVQCR